MKHAMKAVIALALGVGLVASAQATTLNQHRPMRSTQLHQTSAKMQTHRIHARKHLQAQKRNLNRTNIARTGGNKTGTNQTVGVGSSTPTDATTPTPTVNTTTNQNTGH